MSSSSNKRKSLSSSIFSSPSNSAKKSILPSLGSLNVTPLPLAHSAIMRAASFSCSLPPSSSRTYRFSFPMLLSTGMSSGTITCPFLKRLPLKLPLIICVRSCASTCPTAFSMPTVFIIQHPYSDTDYLFLLYHTLA